MWGELIVERERQDLEEVNRVVRNRLLPWWDHVQVYICQAAQENTWNHLPAAVLAVYHYLGHRRDLAIKMAAIFKMVYLASSIHEAVGDDEEGQVYDQHMQFTILIGDYISGCILKMLVESGADHLLDVFADAIAQINEGMVMKHKLEVAPEQVISKTRASLYKAAFVCAARTSGVETEGLFWYAKLGFHIGMALETQSLAGLHPDMVSTHSKKSQDLFYLINQKGLTSSTILELLIRDNMGRDLARAVI